MLYVPQCMCIICGHCANVTAVECVCCNEKDQCQNVTGQSVSAESIQCITEHQDFEAVCKGGYCKQCIFYIGSTAALKM